MARAFLFYNPLAGDGAVLEDLPLLEFILDENCVCCDLTRPETYESVLFSLDPEDAIVLCGGDGTLHTFVNLTKDLALPNPIFCFPTGHNNDFAADFGRLFEANPFLVTHKLKQLPELIVKKRSVLLLNGLSVGLPGGKIRRTSRGEGCYALPKDLSLTLSLEGQTRRYDRVGLMAVLYGRHYAGGMTPIPQKQRGDLTMLLCHHCGNGRRRRLLRKLRRGKDITGLRGVTTVSAGSFDMVWSHPVPLWVDGDLMEDVTAFRITGAEVKQ